MSWLRRIREWIGPKDERERGRRAAEEFLANDPSQVEIDTNFMMAQPPEDDFDSGWLAALEPYVSENLGYLL